MAEVFVHGSGGREQAIKQAMEASSEVSRVVAEKDIVVGLEAFSGSKEKPFVIIGPEAPLVAGLADDLRADGYVVFGAGKEASQFEASKSRTTKMTRRGDPPRKGVPHPDTFIAQGDWMPEAAREYVEGHHPLTYVIKADGLAGGKGVVLPKSKDGARETVEEMISGTRFGEAGREIINFQKRHRGQEASAVVVVGGGKKDFIVLPLSQDYKRLTEDPESPNTGGMGAYAPVPHSIVGPNQLAQLENRAYYILDGIEAEGVRFERAALYMGLMFTDEPMPSEWYEEDAYLLEINVRFGDPETQAQFPLLVRSGVDVYRLLRSAAEGQLEYPKVDLAKIGSAAVTVCEVAKGYPEERIPGAKIHGLDRDYEGVTVQLASVTQTDNNEYISGGGRVLYVTGVGETVNEAAARAYSAIGEQAIHFDNMQYRKDIAHQALKAS